MVLDSDLRFVEQFSAAYGRFFKIKKVIAVKQTKYQKLELMETFQYGKVLVLDGKPQIAEYGDYFYHEPLAQLPMLCNENPKKVLIIGGGDGGSPKEVLKHNVEKVKMVEIDGEVVSFAKEHLKFVCGNSYEDKRLDLHIGDGRKFVDDELKKGNKYDVIICDLTDPFGPSKMLYTREFYKMVKMLLAKKGVFSLHCDFPLMYKDAFPTIVATLKDVFPYILFTNSYVPIYSDLLVFAVCSEHKIDEQKLTKTIKDNEEKFDLRILGSLSFGLPKYLRPFLSLGKVSTDKEPFEINQTSLGMNPY